MAATLWAAIASVVALVAVTGALRIHATNLRLEDEIARRDRTDFLVELDACAQSLMATRSVLADGLDWMAGHHLADLREFGARVRVDDDETFDFERFHRRKVWEEQARRINVTLVERGVAPLRVQ
jgi:hypothetical protein